MVEPIAIIGSACRLPGDSNTPSKLWDLLSRPQDLSAEPPASRFDVNAFYHPVGTHAGTTNARKSYWLNEDVATFDAGFFNIQTSEAEAMDPQQRLLLEVVYDSLCSAGQPMENLQGSDTAVFVGSMCDDYNGMLTRDWETVPRYTATGLERGILANRVSYFFDWHGPSVSVDTACSSSLVALDHAVQQLRSGRSRVALAAGTSLILSPAMYVSESMLGMLSPTGRCAMWDAAADGYARGEGVAAVVLKPLSQALADNDPILSIIRQTDVNQDGRTPGLTMPSSSAQAALIAKCYADIGLDPINNPEDRPQFFQAHGTGTQAGDPQEAEAISTALFPPAFHATGRGGKLLVGSIKTVIGHTEGTAGLASVIATTMALRKAVVPPNLHYKTLNAKVAPFYNHLQIPTQSIPWPAEAGKPRRASVNSFGFGGTNAHCILESHTAQAVALTPRLLSFTPLVFSAASETALRNMIALHLDYIRRNPDVSLPDLAYTLQHRRSTLPYRAAVPAANVQEAYVALEQYVQAEGSDGIDLSTRRSNHRSPEILGVFTGQGAQWARMGAEIVEKSSFGASRLAELDAALQSLPTDRPSWTLKDQLLLGQKESRVSDAEISQPLSTAVQILLVDILRTAGITFSAVVGHSSGEIGAAYAAGFISAADAIRIAHLRGVYAKLASSPSDPGRPGAMLAMGSSHHEAQAFCDKFPRGGLQVAAVNSSSSVTLSGDQESILEAEAILSSSSVFVRKLMVDTAYHSAHMNSCALPYLRSLERCKIGARVTEITGTAWYSSVSGYGYMTPEKLTKQYWVDNMCNTVLFADALAETIRHREQIDLAIEVGPHPALKGPALSVIEERYSSERVPYFGVLSRGKSDIKSLSEALGNIWIRLGSNSVSFSAVESLLSGINNKMVLEDLPGYPFDHHRRFWTGSRLANHFKNRRAAHHPSSILGNACSEAVTTGEFQWRNFLSPGDLSWLKGHALQGQTVFPATGYVSMAIEALNALARENSPGSSLGLVKLTEVEINRAIPFSDDSTSVETIFSVSSLRISDSHIEAVWACHSVPEGASGSVQNARGRATASFVNIQPDALASVKEKAYSLTDVDESQFYEKLSEVGYGYAPPFRGLSDIQRKLGYSTGLVSNQAGRAWADDLVCHPGLLDSALQTAFAAWSYPGDTNIWSLHVPVHISAITLNQYFTDRGTGGRQDVLEFESFLTNQSPSKVTADINLYTRDGGNSFAQIEGVVLVPFSQATKKDDLPMFSQFHYQNASPDGRLAAQGETLTHYEKQLFKDVEQVSYWFVRNVAASIPSNERADLLRHYQRYLEWCDSMVHMVTSGKHPTASREYNLDTYNDIVQILDRYRSRKDVRFVEVVGKHLVEVIREGNTMLQHMNQDGLLSAFYDQNAICAGPTGRWLARIISQIAYRYPGIDILEVGAGTGATTEAVLGRLGNSYNSYTFTDISSGFFPAAEERFDGLDARILYKTFNMEASPSQQGFEENTYDVIIAVNVLHVSGDVVSSLSNVRRLLRPGGYLVTAELTSTDLLFSGMTVGTLPGWWIGADTGRPSGPLFSLSQWNTVLKKAGFSGIDTVTPDISESLPMSVFVTQATDDRVSFLRSPLTISKRPEGIEANVLAIIGGETKVVGELVAGISHLLSHQFHRKQLFRTLEDFAKSGMAHGGPAVTVLSVTDLDSPYLKDLTEAKFTALQRLWAVAGTVVWVTCGSRQQEPWSHSMLGITRTVRSEYSGLNVQVLDLEFDPRLGHGVHARTASNLADALLRQHLLGVWEASGDPLLWSNEPEVYLHGGTQLITRLLPDEAKNLRYNAHRRDESSSIAPGDEVLQLVYADNNGARALELHQLLPFVSTYPESGTQKIQLIYCSLQYISVGAAGMFSLCVGINVETNEAVLALAPSRASIQSIPSECCLALRSIPKPSTIIALAADIMADRILSVVPPGSTVLVNEPDKALQSSLSSKASLKSVVLTFISTSSDLLEHSEAETILLNPDLPRRVIRSAIPAAPTAFIHFSRGARSDKTRDVIKECLHRSCIQISGEAIMSLAESLHSDSRSTLGIADILRNAWVGVLKHPTTPTGRVLGIADVTASNPADAPLTVVDWTTNQAITAKVRPIDSCNLFRPDRTYLFIGMSGELGQSLARWMIDHGAGHVVLTSRNPRVNVDFVEHMHAQHGAAVHFMSLDITSRESLLACYAKLQESLPPLAGVINGAMILDDALFNNMTVEQFTRVTAPKARGTQLLDELFHDSPLDFFIVTTSIASVIGWSGQSNYSAANEHMISLMNARRGRGLHAAAMSIPAVVGIGYAAHADNFDMDYFASLGYLNISEHDLHLLVAEAIWSGRPDLHGKNNLQVCMGVNFVPSDLDVSGVHKRDVRFGHMTLRRSSKHDTKAAASRVQVKTQLETAAGPEDAWCIVEDGLKDYLRRILRIPEDESIDTSRDVGDMGVDSLVAVEIRSWFMNEAGVDMPTLKILGRSSISSLLTAAVEQLFAAEMKEVEVIAQDHTVTVPTTTTSNSDATSSSPGSLPSEGSGISTPSMLPLTPFSVDDNIGNLASYVGIPSNGTKVPIAQTKEILADEELGK